MSNGTPPITSAPSPPSAPGTVQPVIMAGQSLPPSFPLGQAGSWLPPPEVGFGENLPFSTLVVPPAPVPPSVAGVPQPQFVPPGSATVPTAASLFPAFTAAGPNPPIIVNATQHITPPTIPSPPATPPVWVNPPLLPLPTTAGVWPIILNGWGSGAGPGGSGLSIPADEPATDPPEEDDSRIIASGGGFVPPLRKPPPKGRGKHRG
jgi:hypothetical protein